MKRKSLFSITTSVLFCAAALIPSGYSYSQQADENKSMFSSFVRGKGPRYLDDQLFVALTYNVLTSMPQQMNQYSFPNTISFGYVRDIPLNKRRNIGLGVGVGYSFHTYYTNLSMTKNDSGPLISIMDSDQFKNNRFSMQSIDFPIQLRFRGSTAEKYRFWRVYAGVTPSWVVRTHATVKNDYMKVRYYNLPYLENWLFTANLQVGYGKFTLKADYTINTLFKSSLVQDVPGLEDTRSLNFGLLVYIL